MDLIIFYFSFLFFCFWVSFLYYYYFLNLDKSVTWCHVWQSTTMTTKIMGIARFECIDINNIRRANSFSSDIMSVTNGSVTYAKQMERNNAFADKDVEPVNSSQLSYTTNNKEIQSSRAAELLTTIMSQCVNNKEPMHSTYENNNIFNIPLNYDINQARDSNFWDSNF